MTAVTERLDGAQLFARYAYPPNALGYCGPDDHRALFDHAVTGVTDPGLEQLAQGFAGAWPYLQLIAESTGAGGPLDRRVVEAYWVGNDLLAEVDLLRFGNSLEDRFRPHTGRDWPRLAEAIVAGGVPHHSFAVFCVYPWRGRLLTGDRHEAPLHVLDRCRIRWGEVVEVLGDTVLVRTRLLQWDGRRLRLGDPELETARCAVDGTGILTDLVPGDMVSLHWDWVCDRLSPRELAGLRRWSTAMLAMANALPHPGPAEVLTG